MSESGNALIKSAESNGSLSKKSVQSVDIPDLGAQITEGLGISTDDVIASQALLVSMLIDDSSSIQHYGNAEAVRSGYNQVIEALRESKQRDGIFAHTRYLNGSMLYPYTSIDQVPLMDNQNYNPVGGTPLFDQSVVMLGTLAAKVEDFAGSGVPARSISLIVTDGDDLHSTKGPDVVRSWVDDLLAQETHIIAGMGIDDGHTDFKRVFQEMGIPDEWILTADNTPSEIRKAFGLFSRSAVQASQGVAGFSQTALGGFGN